MQQNVQKSSRTILPRSSESAIGPELIQPTPPRRLGARPLGCTTPASRADCPRIDGPGDAADRLVDRARPKTTHNDDSGDGEEGRGPSGSKSDGDACQGPHLGGGQDRIDGTAAP